MSRSGKLRLAALDRDAHLARPSARASAVPSIAAPRRRSGSRRAKRAWSEPFESSFAADRDGRRRSYAALPSARLVAEGDSLQSSSMRILIANDDGYLAPGLAALVKACEGLGDLDVVAPEQNASGTSNSLTLNRGLSVYSRRERLSLHQRHAVRLRPSRALGAARAPSRSGRLRHQPGCQHGRRHAVLGNGRGGDGRLPVRHSGDRVLASGEGMAGPRCGGARRAQRHRARPARSARGAALPAQRQHPEPRRRRHAAAPHHAARSPSCRASR